MPRRNHTPKHIPFIDTNPCKTKRFFAREIDAKAAIAIQELQGGDALSIYKCDRCTGWHLSSKKRA